MDDKLLAWGVIGFIIYLAFQPQQADEVALLTGPVQPDNSDACNLQARTDGTYQTGIAP